MAAAAFDIASKLAGKESVNFGIAKTAIKRCLHRYLTRIQGRKFTPQNVNHVIQQLEFAFENLPKKVRLDEPPHKNSLLDVYNTQIKRDPAKNEISLTDAEVTALKIFTQDSIREILDKKIPAKREESKKGLSKSAQSLKRSLSQDSFFPSQEHDEKLSAEKKGQAEVDMSAFEEGDALEVVSQAERGEIAEQDAKALNRIVELLALYEKGKIPPLNFIEELSKATYYMSPWKLGSVKNSLASDLWKALECLPVLMRHNRYRAIEKQARPEILNELKGLAKVISENFLQVQGAGIHPDLLVNKEVKEEAIYRQFPCLLKFSKLHLSLEDIALSKMAAQVLLSCEEASFNNPATQYATLRAISVFAESFLHIFGKKKLQNYKDFEVISVFWVHLLDQFPKHKAEYLESLHSDPLRFYQMVKKDFSEIMEKILQPAEVHLLALEQKMKDPSFWQKGNPDYLQEPFLEVLTGPKSDAFFESADLTLLNALAHQMKENLKAAAGKERDPNLPDVYTQKIVNFLNQCASLIELLNRDESNMRDDVSFMALEYFIIMLGSDGKHIFENEDFKNLATPNCMLLMKALDAERNTIRHAPYDYARSSRKFSTKPESFASLYDELNFSRIILHKNKQYAAIKKLEADISEYCQRLPFAKGCSELGLALNDLNSQVQRDPDMYKPTTVKRRIQALREETKGFEEKYRLKYEMEAKCFDEANKLAEFDSYIAEMRSIIRNLQTSKEAIIDSHANILVEIDAEILQLQEKINDLHRQKQAAESGFAAKPAHWKAFLSEEQASLVKELEDFKQSQEVLLRIEVENKARELALAELAEAAESKAEKEQLSVLVPDSSEGSEEIEAPLSAHAPDDPGCFLPMFSREQTPVSSPSAKREAEALARVSPKAQVCASEGPAGSHNSLVTVRA